MLESIGVDSIKELSRRNAASLTKMIAERHGKVVARSESVVAGWIAEAVDGAQIGHDPRLNLIVSPTPEEPQRR
jgi:hypothetical protein